MNEIKSIHYLDLYNKLRVQIWSKAKNERLSYKMVPNPRSITKLNSENWTLNILAPILPRIHMPNSLKINLVIF